MTIKDRIENDFIYALRNKDMATLGIIRLLKNSIKLSEIENGQLSEDQIIAIVRKQAKQLEESIAIYQKLNREDAAKKEIAEFEVVKNYLPAEISDEELGQKVTEAIGATEASSIADLGKVMAYLMPKLKGKVDGARLSTKVKDKLSS